MSTTNPKVFNEEAHNKKILVVDTKNEIKDFVLNLMEKDKETSVRVMFAGC